MLQFYVDYMDRLADLHSQIGEAVADLPAEALDWSPGPEMNSIGVLIVHLAGAERYWIGDVAGQDPSGRDRAAEFRAGGLTAQDLIARMEASRAHAQGVLAHLSLGRSGPRAAHPCATRTGLFLWHFACFTPWNTRANIWAIFRWCASFI